jgi:hypothetical protein
MPTQVDSNGAIVDVLPPAGSSGTPDYGEISPDVVTVSTGFPWTFWVLLGLGAWLLLHGADRRRSRARLRRQVRHARARR